MSGVVDLGGLKQDDDDHNKAASDGPQLRLLQCFTCKTLEEMPDFLGHPDDDAVLHTLDERHGGASEMPHHRALHRMPVSQWESMEIKRSTVKRLWEGTTGFTPSYYDVKNTLQDDASKCFTSHHRQVPCIDWHDSSKKLTAGTSRARRKLADGAAARDERRS